MSITNTNLCIIHSVNIQYTIFEAANREQKQTSNESLYISGGGGLSRSLSIAPKQYKNLSIYFVYDTPGRQMLGAALRCIGANLGMECHGNFYN